MLGFSNTPTTKLGTWLPRQEQHVSESQPCGQQDLPMFELKLFGGSDKAH